MAKLSPRQTEIMAFIRAYHSEHQYMPSVREIQAACEISSTSVVDYNLRILQREGVIRRAPDISRGLELTGEPAAPRRPEIVSVPVIGNIAAGAPLPVITQDIWQTEWAETISLPPELTPRNPKDLFALRVKGTSMIDALIDDGDVVVLRATRDARDGDMVAAWITSTEETTLKRFYREGDRIRLEPANAQMEPIIVAAKDVEIHGRVVAVFRTLE